MTITLSLSFTIAFIYLIYLNILTTNKTYVFPKQIYILTASILILIWWCTYIYDLYYFYLWWETVNIVVYFFLIILSYNLKNYKAVLVYFLISFISSLIFLVSLYNIAHNPITQIIIFIGFTLKLRLFPFSHVITKIYDDLSYIAFLTLSSYIYFHYILLFIKFNLLFFIIKIIDFEQSYFYIYLPGLLMASLLYSSFLLDKMRTSKSF